MKAIANSNKIVLVITQPRISNGVVFHFFISPVVCIGEDVCSITITD